MKKNVLNWLLMAAMVCGFSLNVTSCKDDDDDKTSEQRRDDADPLDTDEASTAFRWLCVLADATTLDDNWQKKTYEPTIGQASENNEYTRLVIVKDLAEAKVQFAKIANLDVNQLGSTQTVNGGAAGTMTWTPSKEGAENLAEVAVNSKIMPHLQKLIYCTEAQVGSNGLLWDSMKGTAYYRFGDVVKDAEGYYWVCVRPSFAPDKGDSHWINIFNAAESGGGKTMPAANVKDTWNNLAKYNNQTIKLPTKLSYDREHIYNLSNLIWALINPEAYAQANVGISDGALGGFDYKYHGEKFLKAVGQYWEEKIDGYTIWEKLFNHTGAEMQKLKYMHFFYYGYSWKWGNSGYCYRYSSQKYEPHYYGKVSDDEEEFEFVDRGFDITYYANTPDSKDTPFNRFTTDAEGKHAGTWVVRYMRGDKLKKNGTYSPYIDLGFTDVYRFNQKQGIAAGENVKPMEEDAVKDPSDNKKNVNNGEVIGYDGNFYKNAKACTQSTGKDPVAIVVVTNETHRVEAGTDYNGLAISLNPVTAETAFGAKGEECTVTKCTTIPAIPGILNGLASTTTLKNGCGKNHNHPVAKALSNVNSTLTAAVRQKASMSDWFIPSVGQWQLALQAMGVTPWRDDYGFTMVADRLGIVESFFNINEQKSFFTTHSGARYFSSTAYDKDKVCVLRWNWFFAKDEVPSLAKDETTEVIPFIAFKYGEGATED